MCSWGKRKWTCTAKSFSTKKGLASYSPQAQSCLLPAFVNKILLDHCYTHSFEYCLWLLCLRQNSIAGWPTKLNIFPSGPLQKRFVDACFKGFSSLSCSRITWGTCSNIAPPRPDSASVRLGQDLGLCNPDESPGEADTASSRTTPGQPLLGPASLPR